MRWSSPTHETPSHRLVARAALSLALLPDELLAGVLSSLRMNRRLAVAYCEHHIPAKWRYHAAGWTFTWSHIGGRLMRDWSVLTRPHA